MTVPSLRFAVVLALAAAAPLAAQSPLPSPSPQAAAAQQGAGTAMRDSLAHSRRLTQWFFNSQADSLRQFIPADMQSRFTPDVIAQQLAEITSKAGTESEVIEEKFVKRNGNTQYWRTAKFSLASEPMLFRWAFDKSGQIIGMGFGGLSQAPPIDP